MSIVIQRTQVKPVSKSTSSQGGVKAVDTQNKKVNTESELKDKQIVDNGRDVTSKVEIKESKIDVDSNPINPHRGQRALLNYHLFLERWIREGDYFDFTLSKNVNTRGIARNIRVPDIKTSNGNVIAKGQLLDGNKVRYTFTDYVKEKKNIHARIRLSLFVNPKEGFQKITSTLATHTTEKIVDVKYLKGAFNVGVGVNSEFSELDKENNHFKHIAYINTQNKKVNSTSVYGQLIQGYKPSGSNFKIKVYKVKNGSPSDSLYNDLSNRNMFEDVTDLLKQKNQQLTINQNDYQLNEDVDGIYIVEVEGEFQGNTKELHFKTTMSGYPKSYPYYMANVSWDSRLIFRDSGANGEGERDIVPNPNPDPEPDPEPHPEPEPQPEPNSKSNSDIKIDYTSNQINDSKSTTNSHHIEDDNHSIGKEQKNTESLRKNLPETCIDNKQIGLFGGLLTMIGLTLLFGRRKKTNK